MKHGRWHICLQFVPRDFWIGIFVDRTIRGTYVNTHQVYICILPMLPIRVIWHTNVRNSATQGSPDA